MNWKKEGYKVDQTAFLKISSYFIRDKERYTDCKVIHAGTKHLKVVTSGGTVLKFSGKKTTTDKYGECFEIYKSKEDYYSKMLDIETKFELKNKIIMLLDSVNDRKVFEDIILMLEEKK